MKRQDKSLLNKTLNTLDVLMLVFGAMIGWGWVISSGSWIQQSGVVGTIIGFIIGGIMIYFVGLVYAELTTAMPYNGGAMLFSLKALGPVGSFVCTWFMILGYIGVVCFEACSFPTIISYVFPSFLQGYMYTIAGFDVYATWLVVAIVTSVIIMAINIAGVKAAAVFQNILTLVIALVGILLIAASVIKGDMGNLEGQVIIGENIGIKIQNILAVATVAPFFLFGFDVIPQAANEINIPLKKVGKVLVGAIFLAVAFYALIVFAIGYGMNAGEIDSSVNGSGLVAAEAMSKLFNSKVMANVLLIGGMCGIITSWNSFMIGGSRAIASLSEARMLPGMFKVYHKKSKTPIAALVLIGVLSIIAPFFGREMLNWIADAASFSCCVTYCMVAISYIIIRKREPELERPFKVKHWKFVGTMAIIMSGGLVLSYIIPFTGGTLTWQEFIIVGFWILLGGLLLIISKRRYKNEFGMHEIVNKEDNTQKE